MTFLEKDLEQIIYDADKELLAEKGLSIYGKLFRQLRIGNYGIADLVEFRKPEYNYNRKFHYKGEIIVYELKQNKIGISAFLQALGYIKGIKDYLKIKGSDDEYNYRIVLIGKEIDLSSNFIYLNQFISNENLGNSLDSFSEFNLNNYIYSYSINGIEFNSISDNYSLTDKGF
jgi:hypothetical protein